MCTTIRKSGNIVKKKTFTTSLQDYNRFYTNNLNLMMDMTIEDTDKEIKNQ